MRSMRPRARATLTLVERIASRWGRATGSLQHGREPGRSAHNGWRVSNMSVNEPPLHSYRWSLPRIQVFVSLVALWLVVWFAPRFAHAQSEADRATARNLAAEGNTALKTQDFATAEDRFRRADALVHAPTLVVDHARALIGLGRYVEAQERLELVVREGVKDNAPWVWKKAVQDAEQLVNIAKPKVAWLTINVTGPSDPTVLVDGTQVPVAALGVRRAVDPGSRHISAAANGYASKQVTLNMPQGGERAVTLELAPDIGAAPVRPRAEKPPKHPAAPSAGERKEPSNTLAYAAIGLGGASLVVGTVAGVAWLGKRSDLRDKYHCAGGKCGEEAQSTLDAYHRYGYISSIGFGVGLASSVLGVWLLVSHSGGDPAQRAPKASVVPYVSIGDLGLMGAF
jgi:hypothetical protein